MVRKVGRVSQNAVSVWIIGDVYADPCKWSSTLIDPPPVSSVDALAAALSTQQGVRASIPTDITVDGLAGKYVERMVPAGTNLDECNGAEFRPWLDTDGGTRFVDPGQEDLLWIVDVDGVPLVIDAAVGAGELCGGPSRAHPDGGVRPYRAPVGAVGGGRRRSASSSASGALRPAAYPQRSGALSRRCHGTVDTVASKGVRSR